MGNRLGSRRHVVDDKYTRPQGLYQHIYVDHKKLRKLILDSKLAPCFPGCEDRVHDLEECPICFLYYPSLNRSRCCMKGICTECFLQMKAPDSSRPTQCPFCKTSNYAVEYRGVKSKEERGMEQIEEQRVIEAKIRMRQQEIHDDEERTQKMGYTISRSVSIEDSEAECISVSASSASTIHDLAPMNLQHQISQQNGDEDIDLDIEDVMVMEAIWRSIQREGCYNEGDMVEAATEESSPSPPPFAAAGSFGCAVAAALSGGGAPSSSSSPPNMCAAKTPAPAVDSWSHETASYCHVGDSGGGCISEFETFGTTFIPDSFEERMLVAKIINKWKKVFFMLTNVRDPSKMWPESIPRLRRTLKALCYSGKLVKAIGVLCRTDLRLDCDTYALILQECISRKDYKNGRRIHAQMIEVGIIPDEFLKIKLLILYSLSGNMDSACVLFNRIPKKTLICWNAIISGCIQKGLYQNGLGLYQKLRLQEEDDISPDHFTFALVLKACACLANLEQGRHVHALMLKSQPFENVVSNTSLIDMYFKCSSEVDAQKVFDQCSYKNVVTWTTLIAGYGRVGRVSKALELFNLMKIKGFRPNNITFLSVLCACARGGYVDEGLSLFFSMGACHGVLQTAQHHAVMVNLLGRAGHLELARRFAQSSPFVDHPVIWGALMGASLLHCNLEVMKFASRKLSELGYNKPDKYVFMSNAYASFGFWNDVSDVRWSMKEARLKKEPSYSRIEVNNEVFYFFMGDKLDEGELLYQVNYQLNNHLRTFVMA